MQSDNPLIEVITSSTDSDVLAIIVGRGSGDTGINFVTEHPMTHQLALLNWPRGHQIVAHVHNAVKREIHSTQEILFVRSGQVRVDLYRNDKSYECSRELGEGEVILLVSGGHGFEMLEDSDIVEIKQGPYLGEEEKTRFIPSDNPHWKNPHEEE